MAGVNKVILVGNLGKDPELRQTPQGMAVANFPVATSETWNDKEGQKQERTEWHRIVVWGKLGELCSKYLAKGRKAYVEGRLQTRSWDGQDGQKRYTTEVVATAVQFLDSASATRSQDTAADPFGAPPEYSAPESSNSSSSSSSSVDEIPF